MPPIETPDAQSADSSPAIEVPRDPAEYAKWRQTGEIPAPKAASTPAKDTPASQEGTTAPASETGNNNQEKRDKLAERHQEILGLIRDAGLTPNELKELREELKAFKQSRATKQEQQQAEPPKPAASEKTVNPAELKAPVKPKPEDFKTYDEYEAAREKYVEDLADHRVEVKLQERDQRQRQADSLKATNDRIAEAATRYGGEAEKIIRQSSRAFLQVTDGKLVGFTVPEPVVDVVSNSPVWADLMYTLGSDPTELNSFIELARQNPGAAIRKAVAMEGLIQAELAKGGGKKAPAADASEGDSTARGEDGKFKKTTPEKKESSAPPPPKEVSGRGTPPADEVEQAFKSGDTRSAMRAMNERDLTRRRRG